jgi:arylsulfatase A-like enzyme
MSEAYRHYAEERGLGDACAFVEHNLEHPEWEGRTLTLHDPSPWTFMNGSGILQGPPEAHEENFVAHLAIEKLGELARVDQPWSLVASFWGPHQAYYPTEPFASMIDASSIPEYPTFRDDLSGRPFRHLFHRDFNHPGVKRWRGDWSIWQEVLARAYGQAMQLDAAVGSILDTLAGLGLAENTLVIWCADHGDAVASHGGVWDKASTFTEEVARVPLAIRWPARFHERKTANQLVCNMDVTATILESAGVTISEGLDSRSLLPLCENGPDVAWPDQLICEHNGHWDEYIVQRIIVHDRYKYIAALFGGDELYDLQKDPYELDNLVHSSVHREVREELARRIVEHIEQRNDQIAKRLAHALTHGFFGT